MKTGSLSPDKRTKKLFSEVFSLWGRGARTAEDINPHLQAIVDMSKKGEAPYGLSRHAYKKLVKFWERIVPGKSGKILEVIGEFYNPNLLFILQPPRPYLLRKCQKAVFWKPNGVTGIKMFDAENYPHSSSLGDLLGYNLEGSDFFSRRELFEMELKDEIERGLYRSLKHILEGKLKQHWSIFYDADWIRVLVSDFLTILHYACLAAVYRGSVSSSAFKILLGLWRSGNIPVGFYRDTRSNDTGILVVLCAKEE